MIYENDCPRIISRFKPNGVTDNIGLYENQIDWLYGGKFGEWRRQRQFAKEDYRIDLAMGKIKIRP